VAETREPGKRQRQTAPSTPEEYPTPTPSTSYTSGDFSYTVEVVGTINHALGRLTEAVETLKEQMKEYGKKIEDVRMDVHAAKAAGKTLLWIVGVAGTILGLILAAYFRQIISGGK